MRARSLTSSVSRCGILDREGCIFPDQAFNDYDSMTARCEWCSELLSNLYATKSPSHGETVGDQRLPSRVAANLIG